ncbi:hypothetical protein HN51_011119 [Arachis hypogaea]
MARWLPSPGALNNYVEKFESRAIVPPRYITAEFIHDRHYNLVWNALQTHHLTDFVQTKDDYYPHLVRAVYSTLNYVVPETDEEGIAADEEWGKYNRLVGLQSLQYENPHMDARGTPITTASFANNARFDDELQSIRLYMEGQFADMRQHQDRQTETINHQGKAIDLLYTNLGITNPREIIPRPGP